VSRNFSSPHNCLVGSRDSKLDAIATDLQNLDGNAAIHMNQLAFTTGKYKHVFFLEKAGAL
jgi:hypothetical protein